MRTPNDRAKALFAAVMANEYPNGDDSVAGKTGILMDDCDNKDYDKDHLPVIPAGTEIQVDFGGNFGIYGVVFIDGVIHKVRIELHELHKIHFEFLDGPLHHVSVVLYYLD